MRKFISVVTFSATLLTAPPLFTGTTFAKEQLVLSGIWLGWVKKKPQQA
jgi:hypothetical protein